MFVSKFFQLGAQVVKHLTTVPTVAVSRSSYLYRVQPRNLQSLMHERLFSTANRPEGKGSEENQRISVIFVAKDGEETTVKVPIGISMLEAAHANDIERLKGLVKDLVPVPLVRAEFNFQSINNENTRMPQFNQSLGPLLLLCNKDWEYFNKLDDPSDEENDMLDLAFGLTQRSRLACQIIARPELDGIRLGLPSATRNFAVDGFKPKPH